MILAVDTTREFGSLALFEQGRVVEETPMHSPDGFGHVIYEHLERLLKRHGVHVEMIDCFAAASGPGSFTGVRVGLACVKGLAEATRKPVVAVSNLRALATFGTAPLRATFLDARRGEIYGALYDAALRAVAPEVVAKFPAWLETLPTTDVEFITTDAEAFRAALPKLTQAPRALAGAVAQIAHQVFRAGEAQDPAQIDANYVRRSDAEMFWKE